MTDKTNLAAAEKPRGFIDRTGEQAAAERRIVDAVGAVYERWGFDRLETPAIEYTEALGKFLPDLDRPNEGVFSFQDDERWLSLRYDLTAPLARYVAENFDALPKPYRRWAAGPVWRNEKPGPGRYREFWQCDADTVGSASPAADAEMIAMACEALEAVGIARGDYVLKVSDRRIIDGAIDLCAAISDFPNPATQVSAKQRLSILRAVDKWDRLGDQGVRLLLGPGRKDESGDFTQGAGLSENAAKELMNILSNPGSSGSSSQGNAARIDFLRRNLTHPAMPKGHGALDAVSDLEVVASTLQGLGLEDSQWQVDTSIVRGLEYYTGAVFEAQLLTRSGANLGSVGGGGRYDDLVARFRGDRVPATGFSIGVSRLAAALQAQQESQEEGPVVVLVMDQARIGDAFAMANELRNGGARAEVYLGASGMKAQLKYADKRAAPIAVIQGSDELAKGVVTLKDLKLGAAISKGLGENREAYAKAREQVQREAPRGELVAAVREMLAR